MTICEQSEKSLHVMTCGREKFCRDYHAHRQSTHALALVTPSMMSAMEIEGTPSKDHPPPTHPSVGTFLASPRRIATAVVITLLGWTALLGVVGSFFFPITTSPSIPHAARRRLTTRATAADDDVDTLLDDIQADDPTSAATIAELRSTLAATKGSQLQLPAPKSALARVDVPRYNPQSFSELQKAALAAAMPTEVKGPLPQLVRDMSAAMQKQQAEHEALQKREAQLQPSVLNYNPKDVEQLSKAVGEATASQGAEVSGALPRCCAICATR